MPNTKLKTTFNTAAALYDEIRPGYPEELIRDVVDLSGINDHGRILEIGCGTGKATRPFAERGYELVCLDIGADLIAVAKEKLPTTNRLTHAINFPGAEAFQSSIRRVYPWTQKYSSEQYIKLLSTYSGHIALPDKNRQLLFEGIVNLIETKYDGWVTKHYEAVLDLRKTRLIAHVGFSTQPI